MNLLDAEVRSGLADKYKHALKKLGLAPQPQKGYEISDYNRAVAAVYNDTRRAPARQLPKG